MGYQDGKKIPWLLGVKPEVSGLYFRGVWGQPLAEDCVAVVGSRRMTEYGRRVTELLVPKLVDQGKIIVSGFMYGVDQTAHRICCECGGKTIAVLGWGIEEKMEKKDEELAQKIIEGGGMIISEWKTQKGSLWTFPQRNRIVTAMSSEVFVVEAALKSGALITASLAKKMGKKLWAVPGPITSRVSEGTNSLIADNLAQLWQPNLSVNYENKTKKQSDFGGGVYKFLQDESLTVNDIAKRLNKPVAEVMSELTVMLLRGEVDEIEGKYFWVE